MGGAVQAVGKFIGAGPKTPAQNVAELSKTKPEVEASRMDEEQGARMRGARRRGRQLLSDARLGSADETLGGGNGLGQ